MTGKPLFLKSFSAMALFIILSKILGFAREALIANYLGTSSVADIFYIALIIPTLSFTLIGTVINGRLLPIYIDKTKDSSHKQLLSKLTGFFFSLSSIIVLLLIVFSLPLIQLVAPGFNQTEKETASFIVAILAPNILFMTGISLSTLVFHANEKFASPAFGLVINNLSVICFIILGFPHLGYYAFPFAILLGVLNQMVFQLAFSPIESKSYLPTINMDAFKLVAKLLKPSYPIIIAALLIQLNMIIDRMVASTLDPGSVSALNYSYRLLWLPLSIVMIPISTIFFPKLAKNRMANALYKKLIKVGVKLIVLLSIPTSIFLLIEATPLVTLIYERGSFDTDATTLTSKALFYYAFGIVFIALREFFTQHFYAYKLYKVLLAGCVLGLISNLILSITLAQFFAIKGVALATSVSMAIQVIYYFFSTTHFLTFYRHRFFLKVCVYTLSVTVTLTGLKAMISFPAYYSIILTGIAISAFFYLTFKNEIHNTIHELRGI
ncbi:murein biosynthesis integral membrane protein MurJ [Halalkalibacillus sediminis]|uniref:Murein biosynthesis integral membrane protein MurJ n=1 Tax=Halalkalibacillus sediminis TaxID=2018042 RepID=A0A2I0QU03_9BACI|nr:murein biosynthesis integral membrane protein MurJ [Halalkalibacillus sediminis]PKR77788.1 murein biosynthesis integral membrane protein MurJ [Halalkalibacillus sediminis]